MHHQLLFPANNKHLKICSRWEAGINIHPRAWKIRTNFKLNLQILTCSAILTLGFTSESLKHDLFFSRFDRSREVIVTDLEKKKKNPPSLVSRPWLDVMVTDEHSSQKLHYSSTLSSRPVAHMEKTSAPLHATLAASAPEISGGWGGR